MESSREPSTGSDSTTESEKAFAQEMEATARRLDETARRVLASSGDYERELSVLTARRMRDDSWGAWDDVLDELRRRVAAASGSPSPQLSPSPQRSNSPLRTPSPDSAHLPFASSPLRSSGDARVRSTPELRSRATPQRETPEELCVSLQHVTQAAAVPAGPPGRSVSTGSKGVTFSPVVAEVSWRESTTSSSTSAPSDPALSSSGSDDAADAEVVVVGDERARPSSARQRADRAGNMQEAVARAPRNRIAGFLSRFANFRFSGRKGEKKLRSAGATARSNGSPAGAADVGKAERASVVAGAEPHYVRIPLKEEAGRSIRTPAGGGGGVAHKPPRPARPPPAPGVLETDVDTQRTVLHARSLLALAPPDQRSPRPHKSMEFLLDKDNANTIQVSHTNPTLVNNFARKMWNCFKPAYLQTTKPIDSLCSTHPGGDDDRSPPPRRRHRGALLTTLLTMYL